LTGRRSDAERNRQRLIETAVELLTTDPETNIQEIADASGIGRTTIYRNFDGREDLVEAALAVVIERSQQATGELELDPADPSASIRALSTVHLDLAFRFGPLIRSQDGDSPTVEEAKDADGSPTKVFLEAARELRTIRTDQPRDWQQTVMRTVPLTAIAEVEAGVIAERDAYSMVAETLVAILVPPGLDGR
jgi:AcrR family transcriptional regulator